MPLPRVLKTRMARSLILASLIIGFYLLNVGQTLGQVVVGGTRAISRIAYSMSVASQAWVVRTFNFGAADQAQIINQLKVENAGLRVLLAENDALKNALNFNEREVTKTVLAKVVSVQRDDTAQVLVIDRGNRAGLKNGQAVLTPVGVVIGKVLNTKATTAMVLLLTDIKSRLGITIQNSKETIGILEGNRGLNTIITLIPRTSNIAPGDTVVTSGLDPAIPRGLVVGSIAKITLATQAPFQNTVVASLAETQFPIFVQVVIGQPTK